MTELTKHERLASLTALQKRIKEELDVLKGEARTELLELNASSGVDRIALICNGTKVGAITVTMSHGRPVIKQELNAEALDYLEEFDMVERVPKKGWEDLFANVGGQVVCKSNGEFIDWAFWEEGRPKGTTVTGCKPADVLKALAPKLAGADPIGLLLGGE